MTGIVEKQTDKRVEIKWKLGSKRLSGGGLHDENTHVGCTYVFTLFSTRGVARELCC